MCSVRKRVSIQKRFTHLAAQREQVKVHLRDLLNKVEVYAGYAGIITVTYSTEPRGRGVWLCDLV